MPRLLDSFRGSSQCAFSHFVRNRHVLSMSRQKLDPTRSAEVLIAQITFVSLSTYGKRSSRISALQRSQICMYCTQRSRFRPSTTRRLRSDCCVNFSPCAILWHARVGRPSKGFFLSQASIVHCCRVKRVWYRFHTPSYIKYGRILCGARDPSTYTGYLTAGSRALDQSQLPQLRASL